MQPRELMTPAFLGGSCLAVLLGLVAGQTMRPLVTEVKTKVSAKIVERNAAERLRLLTVIQIEAAAAQGKLRTGDIFHQCGAGLCVRAEIVPSTVEKACYEVSLSYAHLDRQPMLADTGPLDPLRYCPDWKRPHEANL